MDSQLNVYQNQADQAEDNIISILIRRDPREIDLFVNNECIQFTTNCSELASYSKKIKQNFDSINSINLLLAKKNTFLTLDECKEAEDKIKKCITDFQNDMKYCMNIYVDFKSTLDEFLQTTDTVMEVVKVWLNGVKKLLNVNGDIQKLTSLDYADSQIQNLEQIEKKFIKFSQTVSEIRNKEYHQSILNVIIPPKINEICNIISYEKDQNYINLHGEWLKQRNSYLGMLQKIEVLKIENNVLERSSNEKNQDNEFLVQIKNKLNDEIMQLKNQKKMDFANFLKEQTSSLQKKNDLRLEIEDKMKEMKDNNMMKMEEIDNKIMAFTNEINDIPSSKKNYHFIIVSDESGSMNSKLGSKTRFQAMNDSISKLINKRADQLADDIVTIIMFNTKVRRVVTRENISRRPQLQPMSGGGTNYDSVLLEIEDLLKNNNINYLPIVIWLTDGDGTCYNGNSIVERIYQNYSDKLLFFGVGISNDSNFELLKNLVSKANGNKNSFNIAQDTFDLFYHIIDERGFIEVFSRMEEAFEGRNSGIKAKIKISNLIKQSVEDSTLKSQEYLKKMIDHDEKLQEQIENMKNVNQNQLLELIGKRISNLEEELNKVVEKIEINNRSDQDNKEKLEKNTKEIKILEQDSAQAKSEVDSSFQIVEDKKIKLKKKRIDEIEAIQNQSVDHINKLVENKIMVNEYRLKTITDEYFNFNKILTEYELSINFLRSYISRIKYLLIFITNDMKSKTEQIWLKSELGFKLLVKYFSRIIELKEEQSGNYLRKIILHIIDSETRDIIKPQLDIICNEDPTKIVNIAISKNPQERTQFIDKKVKQFKENQKDLTDENEEKQKKIIKLNLELEEEISSIRESQKRKIREINERIETDIDNLKNITKKKKKELDFKIEELEKENISKAEKNQQIKSIEEQKADIDDNMRLEIRKIQKVGDEEIDQRKEKDKELITRIGKEHDEKIDNLKKSIKENVEKFQKYNDYPSRIDTILNHIGSTVNDIILQGNNLFTRGMIGCSVSLLTKTVIPSFQEFKTIAIEN